MAESPRGDGGPAPEPHSHLIAFPEALEAFLTRLPELGTVLGPQVAPDVGRLEVLVRQGLAARDRGDVPAAVRCIVEAMRQLVELAGRSGSPEGPVLAAMAERFATALARGAVAEAREVADVMRERSGSRLVPPRGGR